MKDKKALWIMGTLIFSAITGIYFYFNIHNSLGTTMVVILAGSSISNWPTLSENVDQNLDLFA